MSHKKMFYGVLAALSLCCFSPLPATSGNLGDLSSALEDLADMARSADRAYESLSRAGDSDREYSRYERDWRDYESRLERGRIRTFARMAGVRESTIRDLRNRGYGWESIARRYDIDARSFGYGISRHDHDRDKWRGTPPGLAKKGGIPPGQRKKYEKHHKHGD